MTKAKLARLIALSNCTALFRPHEEAEELVVLQAEFAAWEPDKLREVGAWIVREWLEERLMVTCSDLGKSISAMRDLLAVSSVSPSGERRSREGGERSEGAP